MGSISAEMPTPLSVTCNSSVVGCRLASTRIRPPGSVYLAALIRRSCTTCDRRVVSPLTAIPLRGTRTVKFVATLLQQRAGHLDRLRDDVAKLHVLTSELDSAPRNPRDIEQIVDESHQMAYLPIDHGALLSGRARTVAKRHQLERSENGRKRIPELVSQHGEEFILRAIRRFGLAPRHHHVGHVRRDDRNASTPPPASGIGW